jgi:hypothetical protein
MSGDMYQKLKCCKWKKGFYVSKVYLILIQKMVQKFKIGKKMTELFPLEI